MLLSTILCKKVAFFCRFPAQFDRYSCILAKISRQFDIVSTKKVFTFKVFMVVNLGVTYTFYPTINTSCVKKLAFCLTNLPKKCII